MKNLPPILVIIIALAIPIILNTVYPMTRQDMIGTGAAVLVAYVILLVAQTR